MISFVELTELTGGKIWVRTDHISFFCETCDHSTLKLNGHSRVKIAAAGWDVDVLVQEGPEEISRRLADAGRQRTIFPSVFDQNR